MSDQFNFHFGQYQATRNDKGFEVCLSIPGGPEADFWLPVTSSLSGLVGHIHFTKLAEGCFELDQVRPGLCPMLDQQGVCKRFLCLRKEES